MPTILTHTRAALGCNDDPAAPHLPADEPAGVNAAATPPAGPCDGARTGIARETA